jgi:hypothetical protein
MKALISLNEIAYSYDGVPIGQRVAQVEEIEFLVAPPLFWTNCPDDCVADLWYYSNGQCFPKPLLPQPELDLEP